MDLVIWTYIFGGALIFAVVRGIFSVWEWRTINREKEETIKKEPGFMNLVSCLRNSMKKSALRLCHSRKRG